MADAPSSPRQIHLPQLRDECRQLVTALTNTLGSDEKAHAALASVQLQCEQCGLRLSPADIAEFAQSGGQSTSDSTRLARLHQGYCIRADCSSYYYRLTVQPAEGVDWTRIFDHSQATDQTAHTEAATLAELDRSAQHAYRWRLAAKAALALGVLLLLYLARQWYIGGTIPLLRQPQPFRVDPGSLAPPSP